MKIYEFYIFNNAGSCLFALPLNGQRETVERRHNQELIFGLIYSLKSFCKKFSPKVVTVNSFQSYVTDTYKMHILECHSGLNFLLFTDPEAPDQNLALQTIYSQIFSPCVLRTPFYSPRKPFSFKYFEKKLLEYFDVLN